MTRPLSKRRSEMEVMLSLEGTRTSLRELGRRGGSGRSTA
jgi:hypothetical protein